VKIRNEVGHLIREVTSPIDTVSLQSGSIASSGRLLCTFYWVSM